MGLKQSIFPLFMSSGKLFYSSGSEIAAYNFASPSFSPQIIPVGYLSLSPIKMNLKT